MPALPFEERVYLLFDILTKLTPSPKWKCLETTNDFDVNLHSPFTLKYKKKFTSINNVCGRYYIPHTSFIE